MTTFVSADKSYRDAIEAPGRQLQSAFDRALVVPIDLSQDDLTCAVLMRLKSYYWAQDQIKAGLRKRYASPAADFFVETVAFYLSVFLQKNHPDLRVESEKALKPLKRSMRPDISIWRGSQIMAAVECKTQLGYARKSWLEDFEGRERRLFEHDENAKMFLLVLTGSNWPGFADEDDRIGKQFFVLLDKQTTAQKFDMDIKPSPIVHRIEELFAEIVRQDRPRPA